jgi:serine/threonine protein kinase
MTARGQDSDYERDARPIDRGGQAEVFGARHRPTGLRVAFKRLRRRSPLAVARMRREIEAAQALGGSPHVMPVLDHSPGHDWFVMPLADESAATARAALSETTELRALVTAMCEGLRHAHAIGWIHRDLKPPGSVLPSCRPTRTRPARPPTSTASARSSAGRSPVRCRRRTRR